MKANHMSNAGTLITKFACLIGAAIIVIVGLLQWKIDSAYLFVGACVVVGGAAFGIYLTGKNHTSK
jgi:hypothetical protein